ncbi:MAG: type I-G CRISPR-associated helicase/endonuclease Cas3g [Burkholderiaceae bacterium]
MIGFEEFFAAVNGHAPFPWQTRAAERLARRDTFAVSVPTGLGKSAMVDAAIWAAGHGTWRRIAFVVDRRIVVDAVYQRAKRIEERLNEAHDPRLKAFAERLGEMQVVRLRGGVFGDDDWVLFPERLTVVLTTVDQIGSRLMFRGYGVSPRRWPMHAGFFASDTLIVVDEAHLSTPFLQTLQALREYGAAIDVVPMSATLVEATTAPALTLQADDRSLPVVMRRLHACKTATLIETGPGDAEFAQVAVDQALAFAAQSGIGRIALIVNRVALARKCFERLRKAGADSSLLTGRVRPADRDRQLAELLPQVLAGRARHDDDAPLIVVTTQTIEVGADFDFDAIVTECAPLTALRQRFGRLDRLGERGASSAVILRRAATDRDDPVYGASLAEAWAWLQARADEGDGSVDFGLAAFDALLAGTAPPTEPLRHAASLLPTHVAMLAQTGPFAPEVEIGAWLHGASDRVPDVTLIWRDDMAPELPGDWLQAVSLLPPMLREGLSMPVAAVRRWLSAGRPGEQWSDLGSAADDAAAGPLDDRLVLRWRGADDCEVVAARDIRPGDTLVLPAASGGCDAWGWAPESVEPVADLADHCLAERLEAGASRRVALRLATGHWWACGAAADTLRLQVEALKALEAEAATSDDDLDDAIDRARAALVDAVRASPHPLAPRLRDPRIEHHPQGIVIRGTGIEEIEGAVETGRAVTLRVHHADVGRWAGHLAAGHPNADAVVAAALVHDAGKAEPRMQALLHGNRLRAIAGPVLAKSALRRREEQLTALLNSGLPRGFRHEFASLDCETIDDPLVRHLVATHHGHGRPWLVPCQDEAAAGARYARLEQHWPQAWSAMSGRHGPWTLAGMEWLLRAADARASIEETTREESDDEAR